MKDGTKIADEINSDLERARLWASQWKMTFNADKTEEVIFSSKRLKPTHPPLFVGGNDVIVKAEHKHLGMILDSKLDFFLYSFKKQQRIRNNRIN